MEAKQYQAKDAAGVWQNITGMQAAAYRLEGIEIRERPAEAKQRIENFTTADADRLLGLADQFLDDWAEDAVQSGERDTDYEERSTEFSTIRPLLVAAPQLLAALKSARSILQIVLPEKTAFAEAVEAIDTALAKVKEQA